MGIMGIMGIIGIMEVMRSKVSLENQLRMGIIDIGVIGYKGE